jgi:choline dehydrogenase-like flavoprotein
MAGDVSEPRTVPQTCDVFILGDGPAGSTAAALLAERGRGVVIVEKECHPRHWSLRSFKVFYYAASLFDLRRSSAAWWGRRRAVRIATADASGEARP